MCENMENRWQPCPSAETEHHVAKLRDGRISKHSLDVVLHERERRRNYDRDPTNDDNQIAATARDV